MSFVFFVDRIIDDAIGMTRFFDVLHDLVIDIDTVPAEPVCRFLEAINVHEHSICRTFNRERHARTAPRSRA